MATVPVSVALNPGEATSKFFDLLARQPRKLNKVTGVGDVRVVATTTDANAGAAVDLTAQGFTFPDQSITVVRMRAWGRGANATEAQYVERVGIVLGQPATPVVANATAVSADAGTVAGAIALAMATNNVTVTLLGQASQAMNWIVEVNVEDPVYITAGS